MDYNFIEPKTELPKKIKEQQEKIKELLGKVEDFHGFPNTTYYILPHFMGNYLILYKLAPPDKIPYDELPLARRVGHMLAVPLVGYPLEYCEGVKFLDSNLKETLKSRPLCKSVPHGKSVKYIRVRKHEAKEFDYLEKLDFFQRNFFEGPWLYYQTRVKTGKRRPKDIEHPSFKSARLVKFHPALGKMDVVEVNDLKQDDEKRVLFIPVKWTDYEIARNSESLDPRFTEKLKTDILEINRPYLQIKFDELIQNEFPYQEQGGKSLKSVIITNDYISFDIEITTKGRVAYLMKYAFKRYVKTTGYIEKQWFKKDHFLFFPLFNVKRKYYEDPADHTLADTNRFKRVVRFNPKIEEIKWYFSKPTSKLKWVRDLGHEAVGLLNKALEEADKSSKNKIKIVLNKSGADKDLGDIRYNILNLILIESINSKQFRWGSNIANPITGEVVSATANVWVNYHISDYIDIVRNYIRFRVYSPAWKMKPFSPETVEFIYENANHLQCGDLSREPLGISPFLHEKINSLCTEVSDFINTQGQLTFHPKTSSLDDDDIVSSCAQKLARERILHSILHNMLHSLGLEDITSASTDSENFYKNNAEIKALFGKSTQTEMTTKSHPDPPQYSSVMDYVDLEYPVLTVPGKLDIAALRFLYFDKVEKADGSFLHVPSGADRDPNNPQKTILETFISSMDTDNDSNNPQKTTQDTTVFRKKHFKNYKICGWVSDHPLFCRKEADYGVNLFETVINSICKSHNHFLSKRNRYDGKDTKKYISLSGQIRILHVIWKEYRDNILASQGKSILDYSFLNPNHIEKYNKAIEIAKESPDIKPYYMIRRPIFDYFKRAAFAPAKHCIYRESSEGEDKFRYKAVALENIEEKILLQHSENSEQEKEVLINCKSPVVKAWIKGELVAEVGFFGKERRYLIRANKQTELVDEEQAFKSTLSNAVSRFDEDILEEPEFGAEYYKEWLAYITEGIDLNPYIDREAITDPHTPRDIQFNRVLSYKIDTEKDIVDYPFDHLWSFRQENIEQYGKQLEEHYSNPETIKLLSLYFSHRAFSLTDLRDYTKSISSHPGLHDMEIPFLIQAYKEYEEKTKNQKQDMTFEQFIQTHPAVLYHPKHSLFLLPYMNEEINVMSRLFRRYNEFSKDITEYEANIKPEEKNTKDYNEIEDKKAFTEIILETYK